MSSDDIIITTLSEGDIDNFLSCLNALWKEKVPDMDPTKQHFNVGDKAYICINGYDVEEVIITYIQDFNKISKYSDGSNGFVYYFYKLVEQPNALIRFKDYIKFLIHYYILSGPYFPPKYLGSGHGELGGRGELLHKTPQHSIDDLSFFKACYHIDEIRHEHLTSH